MSETQDTKAVEAIDYKRIIAPEDFVNGWREMPEEVYHSDFNAVNYSSLKHVGKSLFSFHQHFFIGHEKEPTQKMKFGTLAHMALLQGSKFKERYIVMPEFVGLTLKGEISKTSKAAKQKQADWLAEVPNGSIIVTTQERNDLFAMIDSTLSHEQAYEILKDGKPEIIGYWRDSITGLRCRAQLDFLSFNLGALLDVKTTNDCEWTQFRKSVEKLNYPLQLAKYASGVKHITGAEPQNRAWLAIENVFPFEVAVHETGPKYDTIGDFEYRKFMNDVRDSVESGKWPMKQTEIEIGEPSLFYERKYETFLHGA